MEFVISHETESAAVMNYEKLEEDNLNEYDEALDLLLDFKSLYVVGRTMKFDRDDITKSLKNFTRIDPILRINTTRYQHLYPNGPFTDLSLNVSGRIFLVHRAILSAMSHYFNVLLTRFDASNKDVIILHEVNPDLFELLLRAMYGYGIPISGVKGVTILKLANYFQIVNLDIERYLVSMDILSFDELPEFFQHIDLLYPDHMPFVVVHKIRDMLCIYHKSGKDVSKILELLPKSMPTPICFYT